METQFEQKHHAYAAEAEKRNRALDCYEGGARVEKNDAYLIRHPLETQKQYDIRKERATYRNLVAPIVDVFAASINRDRPERIIHDALRPVEVDADRNGASANAFFSNVTRLAAAGGVHFVLVDMEPTHGGTVAEDTAAGRRMVPYFTGIDPNEVFDWQSDTSGLVWAVIHGSGMKQDAPFTKPSKYETLTVWTRIGWTRYRKELGGSLGSGSASSLSAHDYRFDAEGTHSLGVVPLVPFLFEPTSQMTGNSAIDDVLSLVLRVYRNDSGLDKMLFDTAVPLGIINGATEESMEHFYRGSSSLLVGTDIAGINAQYVEPSGKSFASLAEYIAQDEKSIREIGLRMVRKDSAAAESAEARQLDKQQLDTQLAAFAGRCAASERRCFELASMWLGVDVAGIETPYNVNYDVKIPRELDKEDIIRMAQSGLLSQYDALTLLKELSYLPEYFDVDTAIDRLAQGDMYAQSMTSGQAKFSAILGTGDTGGTGGTQ